MESRPLLVLRSDEGASRRALQEAAPSGAYWIALRNGGCAAGSGRGLGGGEVAVFLHVFPKSGKGNLTNVELAVYLKLARILEGLTEAELRELVTTEGWRELEL